MSKSNDIAKLILDEMARQGISQQKMADAIGCHMRTIQGWKYKGAAPKIDHADKALRVLGLKVTLGE